MAAGKRLTNVLGRAALCGAAVVGSLGVAAAVAADDDEGEPARGVAHAALRDASGSRIGTARFQARPDGSLRVRVDVKGLTPGFHGFHVHATGQCVAPFATAGGHQHSGTQTHGAHAGDMPPLLVLRDGTATARFAIDGLSLAELLDVGGDGSALIVHAGRDNLANIPAHYRSHVPDASSTTFGPNAATLATGDAGARAACGVVAGSHGHD